MITSVVRYIPNCCSPLSPLLAFRHSTAHRPQLVIFIPLTNFYRDSKFLSYWKSTWIPSQKDLFLSYLEASIILLLSVLRDIFDRKVGYLRENL